MLILFQNRLFRVGSELDFLVEPSSLSYPLDLRQYLIFITLSHSVYISLMLSIDLERKNEEWRLLVTERGRLFGLFIKSTDLYALFEYVNIMRYSYFTYPEIIKNGSRRKTLNLVSILSFSSDKTTKWWYYPEWKRSTLKFKKHTTKTCFFFFFLVPSII